MTQKIAQRVSSAVYLSDYRTVTRSFTFFFITFGGISGPFEIDDGIWFIFVELFIWHIIVHSYDKLSPSDTQMQAVNDLIS